MKMGRGIIFKNQIKMEGRGNKQNKWVGNKNKGGGH